MDLHKYLVVWALSGLFVLGCQPSDNGFGVSDNDQADDDDTTLSDDDDTTPGDDDTTPTDDDDSANLNSCPNPDEEIHLPAGTYVFPANDIDNPSYTPQLNPEGEFTLDGLTCAEKCPFPGCGGEWIGQHYVADTAFTYRMIDFIHQSIYELTGRRLCTAAEFRAAASLPNHPPYGYSNNYDASACDSSLSPEHPVGELDSCVSALGLRDVTQRAYWAEVDEQTANNYNTWAEDHDWHCVGPQEDEEARIEEGWLVVVGGVNDRCGEAFYGCYVSSIHCHAVCPCDPFTYGNWDVEFADDALRLCVDINDPPTLEQETVYREIIDGCAAEPDFCRDILLEALGWFDQIPVPPPSRSAEPHFHLRHSEALQCR